jgi:hypothetical protein
MSKIVNNLAIGDDALEFIPAHRAVCYLAVRISGPINIKGIWRGDGMKPAVETVMIQTAGWLWRFME